MSVKPPQWLDRVAKLWFARVASHLQRMGSLTTTNKELLACAANSYSSYREAQEQLRKHGRVIKTHTGAMKVSPWLTVEKQAFEVMCRVHKELSSQEASSSDELEEWKKKFDEDVSEGD